MSDRYSFVDDLARRLTIAHQHLDARGIEHYPPVVPWDEAVTTTLVCRPRSSHPHPRRVDPASIRERMNRVKETARV